MDSEQCGIETTGKRKRDSSADSPRKRLNMENEASPTVPEAMEVEENTNQDRNGEDEADVFRRNIIQAMFPGTNIPTPQEVAASSQAPPQVNGPSPAPNFICDPRLLTLINRSSEFL
jgi:hypothetical protein